MTSRLTHIRFVGALLLCTASLGCVRQDGLYPHVRTLSAYAPAPSVVTAAQQAAPAAPPPSVVVVEAPPAVQEKPVVIELGAERVPPPPPQPTSPAVPAVAEPTAPTPAPAPAPVAAPASPRVSFETATVDSPARPTANPASSAPRSGFHSYFINREVRADNIKMFPKWVGMLSRYNSEARPMESICGTADYSPCKLKEWKDFLESHRDEPVLQQLEAVNRFINKYPYIEDIVNWGVDDYWETPYEFQRKSGDCEDFAISKFMSLRAMGVPNDMMRIMIVRDLNLGGIIHAVLVVFVDEKAYMLDNQIKQVIPTVKVYHYVPVYSINEQHWWQHFMQE